MSTRPLSTAAIIAVGSEMLTPWRIDTNSLFITGALNGVGIHVLFKSVVGDDRAELAAHVAHALARVDLIVLTGGLGPTEDDVTREVVADQLGLPLEEDTTITETIRRRFERRGWRMPEINRRQAMVPRGARVIANPNGTAPGLWIEHGDKGLLLVPGPPREMRPMVELIVAEELTPRVAGARVVRRVLRIAGRSESRVEEITQPVYSQWRERQPAIETTILASPGHIELQLSSRGSDVLAIQAALDQATREIAAVLPHDLFSTDGRSMEEVLGDLLKARAWKIAIAESCTGGLTTSRLTDVAGSSAYVERGAITYSNAAKTEMLGVPEPLIAEHGAVSEPVARAMAEGIRDRAGVEVGVGITGIAGPGGGSPQKPVGTVCIAVALPGQTLVRTFRFHGNREQVKAFASFTAMDMARRALVGAPANVDWIDRDRTPASDAGNTGAAGGSGARA